MMEEHVSTGWMRLALRAQICDQCHPRPREGCAHQVLEAHACESACALFVQLPRLARLFERHRAKPPAGYEAFAIQMLQEGGADSFEPRAALDYAPEAVAILEKVARLLQDMPVQSPRHDCLRRDLALGQ
jgi:hypothetical protein